MQFIELRLEDENGSLIKKSEINFADVIMGLPSKSKEDFQWLYGIDPYGLTTFNKYQVPKVIEELERLAEAKKELSPKVQEVIEFMKKIDQHLYIKMVGD